MTARLVALALGLLAPAAALAQHFHQHLEAAPEDALRLSVCDKTYAEPQLDPDIRKVPWKVHTGNPVAQRFFEQGMTLLYGFNYEDALRNFARAKALDGSFAMASWGIALAAGPNINISMDGPCGKLARRESEQARRLADEQVKEISPLEYALTHALPVRYAQDTIQPVDYAVAMREVWKRFRPDPNVGALYAESLFNLRPWGLFDVAKRPAIDTDVALEVLAQSLAAAPDAIGANHYWIHGVEAGPDPARSKASADLLYSAVPASGHLLHMPSHTYLLIGAYAAAADANSNAISVDKRQFDAACAGPYQTYIANPACLQLYYGHYGAHNLFFRAVAEVFLGRVNDAQADARATQAHVQRFVVNEPGLQRYMTAPLLVYAAYGRWSTIIEEPEPPTSCYIQPPFTKPTGCHILRATWRWAQGMAFTSTKPPQLARARQELAQLGQERDRILPPDPTGWGNNSAVAVLAVAEEVLRARIAWAEGKRESAVEHLKLAVTHEDALVYDEPPQWFHPVRQSLGGAYLTLKDYKSAKAAFAEDLERHPGNGRSLYGLARALKELGDTSWQVYWDRYLSAWGTADPAVRPMTDDLLWLLGMPAQPAAGR